MYTMFPFRTFSLESWFVGVGASWRILKLLCKCSSLGIDAFTGKVSMWFSSPDAIVFIWIVVDLGSHWQHDDGCCLRVARIMDLQVVQTASHNSQRGVCLVSQSISRLVCTYALSYLSTPFWFPSACGSSFMFRLDIPDVSNWSWCVPPVRLHLTA